MRVARVNEHARAGGKREGKRKEGKKKKKVATTLGECSEFVNGSVFKCYPWNFTRSTFTGARRKLKKKRKKDRGSLNDVNAPQTHTHIHTYTVEQFLFSVAPLGENSLLKLQPGVIFNPRLDRWISRISLIFLPLDRIEFFTNIYLRTFTRYIHTFEISFEEERNKEKERRGGGGDRFEELKFHIRRIFYGDAKMTSNVIGHFRWRGAPINVYPTTDRLVIIRQPITIGVIAAFLRLRRGPFFVRFTIVSRKGGRRKRCARATRKARKAPSRVGEEGPLVKNVENN